MDEVQTSDIEDKPEEDIGEGAGGGGPRRRGPKPKGPAQKKGKEKRQKTLKELLQPNGQQWYESADRTADPPGIYAETPRIHWSGRMRTRMDESTDTPVWYFLESISPDSLRERASRRYSARRHLKVYWNEAWDVLIPSYWSEARLLDA